MNFAQKAIDWAADLDVDVICMSWAIDFDAQDPTNHREKPLRAAIERAADKNILLFCANPDKGPGNSENKTYPYYLDKSRIFCIGAATKDGSPWPQIDPEDPSCNFYLPGVGLGLPVERAPKPQEMGRTPQEWHEHSGSSLSCALAAGLAGMILHCALASGKKAGDPEYKWLKTYDGMLSAFRGIDTDHGQRKWLPVRKLFGQVSNSTGIKDKKDFLRNVIVSNFLSGMPSNLKVSKGPQTEGEVLRRSTTMFSDA